jgi:murein L,D-transpeptidase YcbB/YkuD
MERWRWLAPDLGTLYVWDNVPEFLTRVVKNGRVIHTDEIIVGQRTWPTPIFSADMKTIAFHPTWGVPDGIKAKELAPLLRKSSGGGLFGIFGGGYSAQAVLDAYDLRAYSNGRQVNANSVDWGNVDIRRYSFQQPPGPKNPLGTVKFMFPNAHDVYMHDTPERNLFAKSFRALSHGCMRVHEPRRLAEILLAEDKGWSASKVGSMYSGSNEVRLDKHIPVHVTYFTARVDEDGKLRTFGDFYGLDGPVGTALLGRKVRFETPRYDDEPVQQDRRAQSFQGQTSGAPNLVDFISNIFSP